MTIQIYRQHFGIEAMFSDCKTGGYNLEGSKASPERLTRLILLIALAMTTAWLQGKRTVINDLGKMATIKRLSNRPLAKVFF